MYASIPVVVYFVMKLLFIMVKVLVFNILVKSFNKDDTDVGYKTEKNNSKKSNKPESLFRDREVETKKTVERINNEPEQVYQKQRVVGVASKAVLGKFTAMFVKKFLVEISSLNIQDIQDKGYFQAQEIARRRSAEVSRGASSGRKI